jgi:2-furoyl-CoA dehydrogenase large subunit
MINIIGGKLNSPLLGQAIERIEDAALLRGAGKYMDDLPIYPGTLYAAVVRSPLPHAKIISIDASKALALKGVREILLPEDIAKFSKPLLGAVKSEMRQWVLAMDRVRYVGEPIAMVLAESRALAEDGVELVEIEYESIPALVDVKKAIQDDAIILHPGTASNCVSDRSFRYGNPEEVFSQADHVISIDIDYPRNSCTPIETSGVIASWSQADESYQVTSNFMGPFSLHTVMAMALNVPANKLRHQYPPDSGGSFGVKQSALPYIVLCCLASRKVGRPVKFIEDRLEHLVAATSATARSTTLRAAVTNDGKILALDYDQLEDCGAYLRAPEPATLYRMHGCLTGAYDIEHLFVRNRVVVINKTPSGLVRGFGGPQVYFALERLVHQIAKHLNKTYFEITALNYVKKEQFPFQAAAGALLDSGDYIQAQELVKKSVAYQQILERKKEALKEGRWYGIGYASIVEPSISNMGYIATVLTKEQRDKAGPKNGAITSVTVSIDPLGGVLVNIASAPAGQGHQTVIQQVVADVFGVSSKVITVNVDFDTHKDAWSVAAGNYSSRFAGAVAGTAHLAADKLKQRILKYAKHVLAADHDALVFANDAITDPKTNKNMAFSRICGAFHWAPGLVAQAVGDEKSLALRETVFWSASTLHATDEKDRINTSAAYGFALDVCGIEIDPMTCTAKIDQYITLHDAGVILNPALADGQIYGAFSQGVGAALFEEFVYSSDGNFLSGTFADYRVPTACEIPVPTIIHMESPSPFTPLGAKGLGEGNNMSTPVCIANAIADAIGHDDIRLPATPTRIHEWLVKAQKIELRKINTVKSTPQAGMPLGAQGQIEFGVSAEKIFEVLLDPERLKNVIPGCESIIQTREGADILYQCVAVVRIGVIKARFTALLRVSEIHQPNNFVLSGEGRGPLGHAEGFGKVNLNKVGEKTQLSYDYQAKVSGKLAAVGSRLVEGSIRIVLDQLFKSLAKEAGEKKASWLTKMKAKYKGGE